jgi:hypothetical protein
MKRGIITHLQRIENKIANLQSSTDKIPNELKKPFHVLEQNIRNNLETVPNREVFQLIINDSATTVINEFKDFMQDMDIKVNFE